MAWNFKYSVVGGVVIPNYIKVITALNGINGYHYYCCSDAKNSKYGVELPKRLTSFMTGTMTLLAGFTAYDMYYVNKGLARMRAVDKTECAKMRARMHPKILNSYGSTGSFILLAGAIAMSMGTFYEMATFEEEMENSANPSV